jgi:hypothetical protein
MGTNGSIPPAVFAPDDIGLDLLAVGRIVLRADDLPRPSTFRRDGMLWSEPPLGMSLGRADCGYPYERTLSLPLPAGLEIAEVALVGHLRCAEDTAAGTPVLRLELHEGPATRHSAVLAAGVHLAERELANPSVAARAKHPATRTFEDPVLPRFAYVTTVRPPMPVSADRLVLRVPPLSGWVTLERLTLVDAQGHAHPQTLHDLYLGDRERWVERDRFFTSRTSDRVTDQSVPGETEYVVLENRRALPRAWLVNEVVPVDAAGLVQAIRHAQLPDGRRFDPRTMALVNADEHAETRRYPPGVATVRVTSIRDGRIALDVVSQGGYLVLSETFYPGWRARIGGEEVEVERANLGLQGIVVPPGTHRVDVEFEPVSLRVGQLASGLGLLAVALFLAPVRKAAPAP